MAERLESFTREPHARAIFPWEEWTDGSVWRITPGEDFHRAHRSMTSLLYHHAKRKGLRVRVSSSETPNATDPIEFQFTERT